MLKYHVPVHCQQMNQNQADRKKTNFSERLKEEGITTQQEQDEHDVRDARRANANVEKEHRYLGTGQSRNAI